MGWRTDKALTVAQLSGNMAANTVPDTTYWQTYCYAQIKNILTGMDNKAPVDQDFTNLTTALADTDVISFGFLLLTTVHTITSGITLDNAGSYPVGNEFSLVGIGRNSGIFCSADNEAVLTVDGLDYINISNMRIYATNTGASQTGVVLNSSSYCILDRLWLDTMAGYGVSETGTSDYNSCQPLIYGTIGKRPRSNIVGANSEGVI